MKKILAMILVMTMVFALCATVASAEEKQYTIGFCVPTTSDAFYVAMMNGVQEKCDELGINCVMQGPSTSDYTLQTPILEAMMLQGVDALLIGPSGGDNMLQPVKSVAEQYNVPIVTLDISLSDESLTLAHISSDNYAGGQQAAVAMDELIKASGKESKQVAVIGPNPASDTSQKRVAGWRDKMKELGYTIVSEQWCKNDSALAASQMEQLLLAFPDVVGVFGANLYCALGIDNGLKSSNSDAVIVTFDAAQGQVDGLKDGTLQATVVQKPKQIGAMGVEFLYEYLTEGTLPEEHNNLLDPIIAYPEDVDNPEISQWFYLVG